MKWEPKTKEELEAAELLSPAMYPFTVLKAEVVTSKSQKNAGKEMLKLKLNVHTDSGDFHIYDYIAPWFMAFKFRHFFFCLGRGQDYEAGTVNPLALQGGEGWCDLGIEKARGEFGPKNKVLDYVEQNEAVKKQEDDDDQVPF